jgi:DNA-directed RNA polymerase specialized sigma24 family protein
LSRHGTEDAEDLLQEALVRLWTEERIHPGHTPGWYLRNCRFHLHNQLRRGRSLGSPRHDRSEPLAGDTETAGGRTAGAGAGSAGGDDGVLSEAAAYDLQAELAAVLDPQEREVLRLLLEGRSTRDAALRLGCSHTAVIHARHRIARRARELGAEPRDAR